MRPLIGITTASRTRDNKEYNEAYAPNARAIERAGGLPMFLPVSVNDDTLRALYDRVDAVLLPGGGDIDPKHFNVDRHPRTERIDADRDRAELSIARWAVQDDRPLFGICRGHQVFNVALGGTLIQDIASLVDTRLTHDTPKDVPRDFPAYDVTVESSSLLARLLGKTNLPVNSLHHQSVARPAPSLQVTAHAPDGVIEGLEMADRRFALSVQWHPEDLVDDTVMQGLFNAFVEAACEYAAHRV